jgi:NAD(P)-dependent dehydrogenase (short-subunit alcohol dehydrogenase family)
MSSKIIVLTGATQGIGRALTLEWAREGHTVLGCGRRTVAVESLQKAIGDKGKILVVDVTDADAVSDWAEEVKEVYGSPDFLINNAAIINQNAHLVDIDKEEFDRVIDINIKGVANVLRSFLPSMIEANKGVVINLSSGWGRSTSPEVAPYCASKYAIEGLTKALAQELPSGMAAIPLSPNTVNTEMLKSCFGSEGASYSPSPEQWAATVAPWMLNLGPQHSGQSLSTPV